MNPSAVRPAFLTSCSAIDLHDRAIQEKASSLKKGCDTPHDIAKACFQFVRDEIKHSWDYRLNPVTLRASEVLHHGTGLCYAKSHLLAALLRANSIPAGLCYQRLSVEGKRSTFCLHGLNAVYLAPHGWYRIDPRGNKEGVHADFKMATFNMPIEALAFTPEAPGEYDLPDIYAEPLPAVVSALSQYSDIFELSQNLPDITP